jgi:hypothetical protein
MTQNCSHEGPKGLLARSGPSSKPSEIFQSIRPSIYASVGTEKRRTDYNKTRHCAVLLKPVDTF